MRSLIIKYLEGKATKEEQAELLNWMRNESTRTEFNQILREWEHTRIGKETPIEYLTGWANIQTRILQDAEIRKNKQVKLYRVLRYAAIFILLISIPLVWVSQRKPSQDNSIIYSQVSNNNSQVAKTLLPDGTEVWLKSGSTLKYNNLFAIGNRDIELQGEAFFNAAKNGQLPMIVYCSELNVKVVGTSFSVGTYDDNGNICVILEEGLLSLYRPSEPTQVTNMKSGEMALYNRTNSQITLELVNPSHFTAWKEGSLNINNQTLEELVPQLARRYNQEFEIDEEAKSLRFTLSIEDETLSEVLDLMKMINPVNPVQKNNVIYLKYNHQKTSELNQNR